MKAYLLLAIALLLAVVPLGRTDADRAGGTPGLIKIVSSLPRTGNAKTQTDTIVNGIRMAIEEVHGEIGDFKIVYEDLDDATASAGQWTSESESANADQAIKDPDVMVYIGTYNSGAAKISMPKLNQASLLMISPANTSPGLTKPKSGDLGEPEIYRPSGHVTYFRVIPTDDLQGGLSADWAKEMGMRRVYVLDDNEVYGKGVATIFAQRCRKIGIEVIDQDSIDAKAQEYRSLMTTIKTTRPDLVYFGGTTQSNGGQIAKDMVGAGLNCPLMVPDGCYEDVFIAAAGAENLNGRCYVTFGGLPPEEQKGRGKVFVERYLKKYRELPQAYAIYGYECGKVALEAIRKAGKKDRAAIVAACAAIKDFDGGALGRWSFDANGDTTLRTMSGIAVRNGKFEFVKVLGEEKEKSP